MSEEGYEDDYNEEFSEEDIQNLMDRAQNAESKNVRMSSALSLMSSERLDKNFLHHQTETAELLERLDHFYRGDVKKEDENGDVHWEEPEDEELMTFNDFGATSMMEIISKYIDKNTILSNYKEERIYQIMGDIGDELILLILSNYEKMGLDTHGKKTKFRTIITTTLHLIESTYRRSISARTLEELNQSKVVGQFGNSPSLPRGAVPIPRKPNPIQRLLGLS